MATAKKWVRAKANGSWDGHRRRPGAMFQVPADAKERWFEDVETPAEPPPEAADLAAKPRSFVNVMKAISDAKETGAPPPADVPQTLAQAGVAQGLVPLAPPSVPPQAPATDSGADLT